MELTTTNIFTGEMKSLCSRRDSLLLKTVSFLNDHHKDYVHLVVASKGNDVELMQSILASKYYDPCKMTITLLSANSEETLSARLLDRFAKHCDLVFVDSKSVMVIDLQKYLKPFADQHRHVRVFNF